MPRGFEVCAIVYDIYVSMKRNIRGLIVGFACLCKVTDEGKLDAPLNNVRFDHYQVWVRLARIGLDSKVAVQNGVGKDKEEGVKVGRGE